MSVAQTIKNQVKAKVNACSSVQKVYGAPVVNPDSDGFPAVILTLARVEGEFSSSAEDSRVYTYNALCIFPLNQSMPGTSEERLEFAEQTLETVVDEIINAIDTDFELDGTPVLYTNASDVEWGYYDYEGGEARAAQVQLSIYTEKVVV